MNLNEQEEQEEQEQGIVPFADEADIFPETGDPCLDEWLVLFNHANWDNIGWFERLWFRDNQNYLHFIDPFPVDHPASKVMPLGGWFGPVCRKIIEDTKQAAKQEAGQIDKQDEKQDEKHDEKHDAGRDENQDENIIIDNSIKTNAAAPDLKTPNQGLAALNGNQSDNQNNNLFTVLGLALWFGWRPTVLNDEEKLTLLTDVLTKGFYERWGVKYEVLLSRLVLGGFIPRDEVIGISLMRGFEMGRRYPRWFNRFFAFGQFYLARLKQFLGKAWYRRKILLK